MIKTILKYLQTHPSTFNAYNRNKPYKPMNGLMYKTDDGDQYLLVHKWGGNYVTYQNQTYIINYRCYHALASGKSNVCRKGIFYFKNGFEDSKEGKLLLESMNRLLTEKEAKAVQALFDAELVTTFVTNYLKIRTYSIGASH